MVMLLNNLIDSLIPDINEFIPRPVSKVAVQVLSGYRLIF